MILRLWHSIKLNYNVGTQLGSQIIPRKNGKLKVYVDYWKLNVVTKVHHYPLFFTRSVLKVVTRNKMYTLMDGYNGYNEIMIVLEFQIGNVFHYKVHNICILGNALWIDVRNNHLPKRCDENICRLPWQSWNFI